VVEVDRGATGETAALDLHEHTRKAVVDAESFRKLRLYSKAIEALRLALDLDPGSVEIRDKLRGVLEESGDLEGAAQEAVRLAEVYLAHQDHETAQALCYEALQLAPENVAARQLLSQLGASPEVPAWDQAYADSARDEPTVGRYAAGPLPSYDLEEMGPTAVMGQSASPPSEAALEHVDDPFAELDSAPLPSFPLGPEDDLTAARADQLPSYGVIDDSMDVGEYVPSEELVGGGAPSYDDDYPADQAAFYPDADAHVATAEPYEVATDAAAYPAEDYAPSDDLGAAVPSADAQVEAVEDALEEADFYASRGLYDDACAVINQQLMLTPSHPLLLERLRELGQLAPGESGTIERSQLGAMRRPPKPRERVRDVGASLDSLDALAPAVDALVPPHKTSIHDEVNVDEVFARFKEGIRQQVPEGDAATHYDLGVAYQGMGLLGDAVREFEVAARDPDRECNCYAMIGLIGLEQGELDQAEAAYLRGLEAEKKSVEQAMSLYYDLGNVKEMKGQRDEALYYFKMIARRDPGFRDVKDRIAALEPPPVASTTRAANEDDEFDAAFDKLFESS
jgi:tetratricopeptide (TPR) repeat protein